MTQRMTLLHFPEVLKRTIADDIDIGGPLDIPEAVELERILKTLDRCKAEQGLGLETCPGRFAKRLDNDLDAFVPENSREKRRRAKPLCVGVFECQKPLIVTVHVQVGGKSKALDALAAVLNQVAAECPIAAELDRPPRGQLVDLLREHCAVDAVGENQHAVRIPGQYPAGEIKEAELIFQRVESDLRDDLPAE